MGGINGQVPHAFPGMTNDQRRQESTMPGYRLCYRRKAAQTAK
jgi:hypothetical protein